MNLTDSDTSRLSRRQALAGGAALTAGVGGGVLAAREYLSPGETVEAQAPVLEDGDPDKEFMVTATVSEIEVAPGKRVETWLYNDQYPGPELRVEEGDRVQITVKNELDAETTIHWHGMALSGANGMDGVPGVTQDPIAPGDEFVYEFDAAPTGTHWYHSHVDLQLDRGLLGPLIIEEADPHIDYDREQTLILDEHLTDTPRVESESGGMMGGMPGAPPYEGTLINGQLPDSPSTVPVEEGERVRLRFINAGAATTYRVAIAGHDVEITHTDGPAVEPVTVNGFDIGMGERFDAVIEADNPGVWEVQVQPLGNETPPGRALLQYKGEDGDPNAEVTGSRLLGYDDLQAVRDLDQYTGSPDQTVDLRLSAGGGMMGGSEEWTINGETYPEADPITIAEDDHVRVRMTNHSPMRHPMHLHGHHFRVGNVLKDTVTVPGHMEQVEFDVITDNPGDWFFHCHHLYHMETGMARVFKYEQ